MASKIDIVIPVYNPGSGWAASILAKKESLEAMWSRPVHFIISDDGSPVVDELNQLKYYDGVTVVVSSKNYGKGRALRTGMKLAQAEVVLFTDADFPYDEPSMQRIIVSIEKGSDIALGYREQDYYGSVPWFRKWLSEAFRFTLHKMLRFPITDTQCGLKGMNQKGKEVLLKTSINRFLVDMEFIQLAINTPTLKIEPVVVQLRKGVVFSKMGINILLPELFNFFKILICR